MNIKKLLIEAENKGADFSDIRILNSESEKISVKNDKIDSIQKDTNCQYGVRVFNKGGWGFAYGNNENEVGKYFDQALKMANINSRIIKEKIKLKHFQTYQDKIKTKGESFTNFDIKERVDKLVKLSKGTEHKNLINKQIVTLFLRKEQQYLNNFGADVYQESEHFNFYFKGVGKKDSKTREIFTRKGMCASYDTFKKLNLDEVIKDEIKRLETLFMARKAPAGKFPIVLNNSLSEVFFHEAVGHACEADAILRNSSVLKGKIGKKIAPDFLTLSDDPSLKNSHGFFVYDDEGIKAQKTKMIENGVFKNYLQSIETANRMDTELTGNGRAQNAMSFPYPRMSNTVLKKRDFSVDELFEGIKKGIYAKESSGGVVEPTNGNFLFGAKEGYLIENGKITKPLLDVSFGGNILTILKKIEKIADDSLMGFPGFCGKRGQMVQVGGMSPHIKISEAMVGGDNGNIG